MPQNWWCRAHDEANSILEAKEKSDDCFAFADVNCRLCVKLDGEFHYFGNLDELRNLVNDTEGENGDEVVEDDEQAEDDGQAKDDGQAEDDGQAKDDGQAEDDGQAKDDGQAEDDTG